MKLYPTKQQSRCQKITSIYAGIVSPKTINVVIFSDSVIKVLKMKQFNYHIYCRKVYQKSFPEQKKTNLIIT